MSLLIKEGKATQRESSRKLKGKRVRLSCGRCFLLTSLSKPKLIKFDWWANCLLLFFFFFQPALKSCNMQLKQLNRPSHDNIGDPEFGFFTNEAIRRSEWCNKEFGVVACEHLKSDCSRLFLWSVLQLPMTRLLLKDATADILWVCYRRQIPWKEMHSFSQTVCSIQPAHCFLLNT